MNEADDQQHHAVAGHLAEGRLQLVCEDPDRHVERLDRRHTSAAVSGADEDTYATDVLPVLGHQDQFAERHLDHHRYEEALPLCSGRPAELYRDLEGVLLGAQQHRRACAAGHDLLA